MAYSWLDVNATNGDHYYRIRSIEQDGKIAYSTVVKVSIGKGNAGIAVYPNPVKNFLNIKLPDSFNGPLTVKISDITGRIVSDNLYSTASNHLKINLKDFAKGTYLVKLVTDKDEFVQRIVVE